MEYYTEPEHLFKCHIENLSANELTMTLANFATPGAARPLRKNQNAWLGKLLLNASGLFQQALRFAGMFYFPKALCFAQKNICGNTNNLKQFVLSTFCD